MYYSIEIFRASKIQERKINDFDDDDDDGMMDVYVVGMLLCHG